MSLLNKIEGSYVVGQIGFGAIDIPPAIKDSINNAMDRFGLNDVTSNISRFMSEHKGIIATGLAANFAVNSASLAGNIVNLKKGFAVDAFLIGADIMGAKSIEGPLTSEGIMGKLKDDHDERLMSENGEAEEAMDKFNNNGRFNRFQDEDEESSMPNLNMS